MTPDELRALAGEATSADKQVRFHAEHVLLNLAPQLALLCADLIEALKSVPGYGALPLPRAVLDEVESWSVHPPFVTLWNRD